MAVEEERQSQAAVSSSKEASSTGERAQFVKQSSVRVSSNEDMKHSLTDANSVKPVFVRSSPDPYEQCVKQSFRVSYQPLNLGGG